jgi:HEAT repeat protein
MRKKTATVDPEYERWKRKYPKFPGVAKCVDLLRSPNVHGSWVNIICAELQENASKIGKELVDAFRTETDIGVRRILLGVIAEAKILEALPTLVENLKSPDESLRYWAIEGLKGLNTPEARRALWEAGV